MYLFDRNNNDRKRQNDAQLMIDADRILEPAAAALCVRVPYQWKLRKSGKSLTSVCSTFSTYAISARRGTFSTYAISACPRFSWTRRNPVGFYVIFCTEIEAHRKDAPKSRRTIRRKCTTE